MKTDVLTMFAHYVSALSHEEYIKWSEGFFYRGRNFHKQRALYYKTRAAILQDRCMRGDLRELPA